MKKNSTSLDGIKLRRSNGRRLDFDHLKKPLAIDNAPDLMSKLRQSNKPTTAKLDDGKRKAVRPILATGFEARVDNDLADELNLNADLNDTLAKIKKEPMLDSGRKGSVWKKRKTKKEAPFKKKRHLARKIILASFSFLLVALLVTGGYWFIKLKNVSDNISSGGNILDIFKSEPLKVDQYGRTNFLVFGTSEDQAGHDAAWLTDSIMIVSVSSSQKDAYLFSIPRDFYVDYGRACYSGYRGKINVYLYCANDGDSKEDEQDRLNQSRQFFGNIFDIDLQYAVHINQSVIQNAVDAVGGIDVDVQGSNGAPGVLDRFADVGCNFQCYNVKYDNGIHHMNGNQALLFSLARGNPIPGQDTYGLSRSNWDREVNQQKVLLALKQKATSTKILTDWGKLTGLLDAVGDNLRSNLTIGEMRSLADLAMLVKQNSITRIDLSKDGERVMGSGYIEGAGSIVLTTEGYGQYDGLRSYIHKQIYANPIEREAASVAIYNGSELVGIAREKANALSGLGFNVTTIDTADKTDYKGVTIYQLSDIYPATKDKLQDYFKVTAKKEQPPFIINEGTSFVVIIGN